MSAHWQLPGDASALGPATARRQQSGPAPEAVGDGEWSVQEGGGRVDAGKPGVGDLAVEGLHADVDKDVCTPCVGVRKPPGPQGVYWNRLPLCIVFGYYPAMFNHAFMCSRSSDHHPQWCFEWCPIQLSRHAGTE